MVLLFPLLPLPGVGRSSDSEKQGQDGCAGGSNYFHKCNPYYRLLQMLALAQASYRCIRRAADGCARYNKLHSSVLLPPGGVVIGGYRQGVAETLCTD